MNKNILLPLLLIIQPSFTAEQLVEVRKSYQAVSLIGFTRSRAAVQLISEEKGRFETIDVDVGDLIDERQRFGCLDVTFVDLNIAANKARQEKFRADLSYFNRQKRRVADLVKKHTSSESELDNLSRQAQGAKADLREADVQLSEFLEHKKRHCIEAKQGWAVTERLVDPGQWVNMGDPVGKVADFSVLHIPFALSNSEYKALKQEKDNLKVRLLDDNLTVQASIAQINPSFDEKTRKISIELSVGEGVPEKRGGLRVELILQITDKTRAVLVPASAVKKRYEQYWIILADGTELAVTYLGDLTEGDEKWVRIVSDKLQPGDQVIRH